MHTRMHTDTPIFCNRLRKIEKDMILYIANVPERVLLLSFRLASGMKNQ